MLMLTSGLLIRRSQVRALVGEPFGSKTGHRHQCAAPGLLDCARKRIVAAPHFNAVPSDLDAAHQQPQVLLGEGAVLCELRPQRLAEETMYSVAPYANARYAIFLADVV